MLVIEVGNLLEAFISHHWLLFGLIWALKVLNLLNHHKYLNNYVSQLTLMKQANLYAESMKQTLIIIHDT